MEIVTGTVDNVSEGYYHQTTKKGGNSPVSHHTVSFTIANKQAHFRTHNPPSINPGDEVTIAGKSLSSGLNVYVSSRATRLPKTWRRSLASTSTSSGSRQTGTTSCGWSRRSVPGRFGLRRCWQSCPHSHARTDWRWRYAISVASIGPSFCPSGGRTPKCAGTRRSASTRASPRTPWPAHCSSIASENCATGLSRASSTEHLD